MVVAALLALFLHSRACMQQIQIITVLPRAWATWVVQDKNTKVLHLLHVVTFVS